MRILVTGGAGFIGSHLTESLLGAGDDVVVLDDFSTGCHDNLAEVIGHPRLRIMEGTIRDAEGVANAMDGVERVFHLAAAVGVRLIVDQPTRTLDTNVSGTEIVLAEAAKRGARVLLASSSEVYGKSTQVPFKEEQDCVLGPTTKPRWGYAASKMLDEFLALGYARERGLKVTIVRLFNTVGPRQVGRYGMVVPRLVEQALTGQDMTVYGNGEQTRCFLHVQDLIRAFHDLIANDAALAEVINLGNPEEITINHLARRIHLKTESRSHIVHVPFEEAYGPNFEDLLRRVPCIEKAQRLIDFQPRIGIDRIIEDVAMDLEHIGS